MDMYKAAARALRADREPQLRRRRPGVVPPLLGGARGTTGSEAEPRPPAAKLDHSGTPTLTIGAAAPVAGKLMPRQPGDGLRVGRDDNAAVSPYATPNAYEGTIHSIVVELDEK